MLGKRILPKRKDELVKAINSLDRVKIVVLEPVNKKDVNKVKSEFEKFAGNDETSVVFIKRF